MSKLTPPELISLGPYHIFLMFTTTNHLDDSYSLEWSAEDFICLLTDKGAFVFTPEFPFRDSSASLFPHKHFIPNPVNPPALAFHTTVKRFIDFQQPRCDWFDYIHLTEGFAGQFNKYKRAFWSPRLKQIGSILALITYDNRLTLYIFQYNEWKQLADCSEILDIDLGAHYKGIAGIKAFELYSKLTIQCMTWSSIFEIDGIETLLLICATHSGHCHFFRLNLNDGIVAIDLICSWKSGLGSIIYCHCFKDYLTLCSLDGKVTISKFSFSAIDNDFNGWTTLPTVTIWPEDDGIPVENVIIYESESNHLKLFFSKNSHILAARFEENMISEKTTLQLSSIDVIQSLSNTYITGMSLLPDKSLLYSSPDRLMSTLKVEDNMETHQTSHPINLDEVVSNLTPFSIKSSRNSALTCVAQTITKLHDHLLLKEPTRIIIFPNISFEELTLKIDSMINDIDLNMTLNSLHDVMDLLNALRGYYAINYQWIPNKFQQLLEEKDNWNHDCLKSTNFKLLRFIALSFPQNNPDYEDAVTILENLILQEHVKHIYETFVSLQDSLVHNQQISLVNMISWGRKCKIIETPDLSPVMEKCPMCNEDVPMDNSREGCCSKKHRLGRCCNSLILCDLLSVQYQQCKLCGRSLYAVPSIWKDFWECLYCF